MVFGFFGDIEYSDAWYSPELRNQPVQVQLGINLEASMQYENSHSWREAWRGGPLPESEKFEMPEMIPASAGSRSGPTPWAIPQPLTTETPAMPFPVWALPNSLQAAVEEVQGFTQAPVVLVASSALGAVSLSAQGFCDVRRNPKLAGPIGLFLLVLAESGERKSTVDGLFMESITEWEKAMAHKAAGEYSEYEFAMTTWEARQKGLMDRIRAAKKRGAKSSAKNETVDLEQEAGGSYLPYPIPAENIELAELLSTKPKKPITPRLNHQNATSEALGRSLATGWPSGGNISGEGGMMFGGHSMKTESIMQNLAMINKLWDGAPLSSERITTDNYHADGTRFTVSLAVQPAVIQSFHETNAALARGSGFWARFLLCQAESTQGTRFYTEPPEHTSALTEFNRRIAGLLAVKLPRDKTGALNPRMLDLSPAAKAAWIQFHDGVEKELGLGGELVDVRDVASKIADNAARTAALFEIYENGPEVVEVSADSMRQAIKIVAWYLYESRRFFGELTRPVEVVEAASLDQWLLKICRTEGSASIAKNRILQTGPGKLRRKASLEQALARLQELGRVHVGREEGRAVMVKVNPLLW
jgi:putative DNA primase/helicase